MNSELRVKYVIYSEDQGTVNLSLLEDYKSHKPLRETIYENCIVRFDKEKAVLIGDKVSYHVLSGWNEHSFLVTDEMREKYELDESQFYETKTFFTRKPTGRIYSNETWCRKKETKKRTLYINTYIIEDKRKNQGVSL